MPPLCTTLTQEEHNILHLGARAACGVPRDMREFAYMQNEKHLVSQSTVSKM